MRKFFKRLWGTVTTAEGIYSLVTAEPIRALFWPTLSAAVTAMLGWAGNIPLMYIWVGLIFAFAMTATGLLRLDEWTFRNKVKDKVTFSSIRVGRSISKEGISLGIQLVSSANFPVDFIVQEIRTQLGDQVPIKSETSSGKRYKIPQQGVGWYHANPIKLKNPPKLGSIEGLIEFKVLYGKSGSESLYELSEKKVVIVAFNEEGLPTTAAWNDAV